MDPRVLDASDSQIIADDKSTTSALREEACAWMSQRPESTAAKDTTSSDRCNDKVPIRNANPETPEVKAAYKALLEKTRGIDPVAVADSLNLFGDLAASATSASKVAGSLQRDNNTDKKVEPGVTVSPESVEPKVSRAYTRLLQQGLKPVVIIDVLNIAGDVAAIATSPQGRKLFEDIKTLISHIRS